MRIDPAQHGWMTAPETVAVMNALGEARFVGGAVRNALLGASVVDVDIAVPMPPSEALIRLTAKDIKVVETGMDHGTVTAIAGTHAFEITSLRRDVETDGRHAKVVFTDDWAEDAARRDFTINALYASATGEIFDYATGMEDLIAGKVRFVGDARTRIAEDYLRVLRLFRFHAWYGKGEIDAEGLRAAAGAKDKLKTLSAERVAKELLRLLEAGNPAPVLRVMAATGILSELLPGALQLPRLERLTEIDAENLFPRDAVLRLASLLRDGGEAAQATSDRLKLSNADRARLEQALCGDGIAAGLSARDARRLLYRIGAARFRDKVLLQWASAPRTAVALPWRMLLKMAENWQRPRFPLTGRDVMQAGVAEGPDVGRILAHIEDWWVDADFAPDEGALRDRLHQAIAQDHR
ncbi:MAG TPA: CCA tRNA nucleotidyltransferase [Rhizomicrobium sp.]|jgi:poly(A) polymerase|nr:CCA tRNA nucleotidyltransferase [Rhizomicrobium sp.]